MDIRTPIIALTLSVLAGCAMTNKVIDPYANLEIKAEHNVNPDFNGRPSPVVLYVYELTSDTIFTNQDFFSLYENGESVLGADLVNKYEISFIPGQEDSFKSSMNPQTEYIGLVAAFRDIENSNWRKVIKVDKTGYETHQVTLDELSVVLK